MKTHASEILLVEDNPNDAELTIRALRQANVANPVVHVEDGEEALDYIFATGTYANRKIEDIPSLILLDLKIPKVNGLQVLQKIKSDERTKIIPVVAFTSSQEDPDVRECYRLGVNSYIVKPLEFDAFSKTIKDTGLYWFLINHFAE